MYFGSRNFIYILKSENKSHENIIEIFLGYLEKDLIDFNYRFEMPSADMIFAFSHDGTLLGVVLEQQFFLFGKLAIEQKVDSKGVKLSDLTFRADGEVFIAWGEEGKLFTKKQNEFIMVKKFPGLAHANKSNAVQFDPLGNNLVVLLKDSYLANLKLPPFGKSDFSPFEQAILLRNILKSTKNYLLI